MSPSKVNKFFNTITRDGQDQIFFEDVVQVIGYLEESKLQSSQPTLRGGLSLNVIEIQQVLQHVHRLAECTSVGDLREQLDGVYLMFSVEYQARHGTHSSLELFKDVDCEMLFELLTKYRPELEERLRQKIGEKNAEGKAKGEKLQLTFEMNPNESSGGEKGTPEQSQKSGRLSDLLKTESDSLLDQISWNKQGQSDPLEQLSERFERRKSKLKLISIRGLEKTAFAGLKKGDKQDEVRKIQTISKVQKYVQEGLARMENIFRESLELIKLARLSEEDLRNKLSEQEQQNRFWERTNEQIEAKLDEAESRRRELAREVRELHQKNQRNQKWLEERENQLMAREEDLRRRDQEIGWLRSTMRQSTLDLEEVEKEKQMLENLKKERLAEMQEKERKNRFEIERAQTTILRLESSNKILEEELGSVRKNQKQLEEELEKETERFKLKNWSRLTRRGTPRKSYERESVQHLQKHFAN